MDISSFIGQYPSREDEGFGYQLFRKKELYDLKLSSSEKVPDEPGIPLQSQLLFSRIVSPYTDIRSQLVDHGVGTGKSCLASLVIENFKNMMVNDRLRKPAIVFVKNNALAKNLRKEIVNRCTKDVYVQKYTENELNKGIKISEDAIRRRIKKAIARSYDIVTYETFLSKLPSEEIIRRKYNDRVIIVDEIHNFKIQSSKKEKRSLYGELWKLLHTIENCIVLLLTGTPMWDQAHEIASIMNLMLDEDSQLPTKNEFYRDYFDEEGDLLEDKVEELKDVFRGRVSVLRPLTTTAVRREIGVTKPWLRNIIVYPDGMSQYQYEATQKLKKETEKKKKGGEDKPDLWRSAMDTATLVFPKFEGNSDKVIGVEYGPEAFKKHVIDKYAYSKQKGGKTEKVMRTRYVIKDPRVKREFKNNLERYSAKFSSIIKKIKDHPNEVVFIYDEHVATGSGGLIMLSLIMELHGMEWAKTASHISKPHPKGKKRFVAISGNPQTTYNDEEINKVLESISRPDNKYAERCQVVIGGPKMQIGFTIKNARQGHSIIPPWNESTLQQAFGRIFRTGSHDALPENERYVNIYRHVAVQESLEDGEGYNEGEGFPEDASFTDKETIDIYIYKQMAEDKEHKKGQLNRLLKIMATDCALLYKRNVLEGDQALTKECDYGDCNYECDGFPSSRIDKSSEVWDYVLKDTDIKKDTYQLYYSTPEVKQLKKEVKRLFRNYFALDLYMILRLLDIDDESSNKRLLLLALNDIINKRKLIKNRYGFSCYLKESGDIYFLTDNISAYSEYSDSIYISEPMITEITSLEDISEMLQLRKDQKLVKRFARKPEKYQDLLDKISYRGLILLLEYSYALQKSDKKLSSRQKKATNIIINKLNTELKTIEGDKVAHIMYINEYTGVGYNVAAQKLQITGKMRVYNPETKEWSFVIDPEEEERYIQKMTKTRKAKKKVTFADNPYHLLGFIDKSGNFKIKVKALTELAPGSRQGVGRAAKFYDRHALVDIYFYLEERRRAINEKEPVFPRAKKSFRKMDKKKLINLLKSNPQFKKHKGNIKEMSESELQRFASLFSLSKDELISGLRKWFEDHDLFYHI